MELVSEFLKKVSFCQDLNESARSKLAELLISKKISAGAIIFREFDESDCLYIVKSGRIIISKHVQDQVDIVLTRFHGGDCFGEMGPIQFCCGLTARLSNKSFLTSLKSRRESVTGWSPYLSNGCVPPTIKLGRRFAGAWKRRGFLSRPSIRPWAAGPLEDSWLTPQSSSS
jgi:hypothetical protein